MKITDYDALTGEAIVRDMDAAELLQIKQLQEARKSQQTELENQALLKEQAMAKLAVLGLTPDDFKALNL